ncbi:MAG: DinB family protein [Bacteroidetes bacterium]|nr:DinB family protein [Bacteroidota bacterium]
MIERKTYIQFGKSPDYSIDYLLGILEDARVTTIQRVENLSIDELHWQFEKGWNTIGVLLSHIISCEHFFRIHFIEGRTLTKQENQEYLPGLEMGKFIPNLITDWSIDKYITQLENSRLMLIKEIEKLDTVAFQKKREGYNPNTGHNLAWTLYHLAEDEVHHRGQISIIRKLFKTIHNKI